MGVSVGDRRPETVVLFLTDRADHLRTGLNATDAYPVIIYLFLASPLVLCGKNTQKKADDTSRHRRLHLSDTPD
jgi:hypothetical protein